jgi:predicted AlkP superfamily phosphohydrolase/phosphomutase
MKLPAPAGTILLSVLITLASTIPVRAAEDAARTAVVLAWDGAVPGFIHEMLRERKLPNLAKLIGGGAFADDVMPAFPSLTAPGFASLWTGAPPRVTGISGNRLPRLPRNQSTILESVVGFNPALMRAETLAAAAERAGRKTVIAYAPLARASSAGGVHLQAYAGTAGRDGVVVGKASKLTPADGWKNIPETLAPPLEFAFSVATADLFGLLVDDPADAQEGYDTLIITASRDGEDHRAKLKAAAPGPGSALFWSRPVEIIIGGRQPAITYFRLYELKADGSDFFLYFTRPTHPTVAGPAEDDTEANPPIKAFIGNGANIPYVQGLFGATIPQGGDGTAESRYLDTVMFLQHQVIETSRWVLERLSWDLCIIYSPYPDEAEHLWRGYLEPAVAGFQTETAARLRPFMERVYQSADELLGVILNLRRENTIFALVSDHGMEGTGKLLAINKALQRAGLLKLDAKGRIDLAGTKALYPSFGGGYLLINSTDRKNGIVPPAEREDVVQKIRNALFEIRDGDRQVVTALYDAQLDGVRLGVGSERGGDLYIDVLPGYELDPRLAVADLITGRDPHGMHGFNPARASMRTLMVLNGPGIQAQRKLIDVRLVDFAPTIAKLLRIPPPRDSWGRVLDEALAGAN